MTYWGFLLRHPLFWVFVAGLSAGAALASATRRSSGRRRGASWRWSFVPVALAVAIAAGAAALIVPPGLTAFRAHAAVVGASGLALSFLGLRFPRVAGTPLLIVVGCAALLAAWMVQDLTPVRTTVELARYSVLSLTEDQTTVEITYPAHHAPQGDIVVLQGSALQAEVDLYDWPDLFFLLGALRFARYLGPGAQPGADAAPVLSRALEAGLGARTTAAPLLTRVNILRTYVLIVGPHSDPSIIMQ